MCRSESSALETIALAARHYEIRGVGNATLGKSCDMVEDNAKMIEKRSIATVPMWVVIGDRCRMTLAANKPLERIQRWRKNNRSPTPLAQPPITKEDFDLLSMRKLWT
jgi:hypothetical protein